MQNDTIKNLGTTSPINADSLFIRTIDKLINKELNKTMENKKYIAPFDIGKYVKKGDILIKDGEFYKLEDNNRISPIIHKEIVESYFEEYIEPKKLITMEDIIVGKTVLISSLHKYEYLVVAKQNNTIIVSWLGNKTIEEINENFTIKQI